MHEFRQRVKWVAMLTFTLVLSLPTLAQQGRWAGHYTTNYCAGTTVSGTPILFVLKMTLTPSGDGAYTGTLKIDGYQTAVRASVYGEETDGKLAVYYDAPQEENFGLVSEHGDLLVTLKMAKAKGKKRRRLVAKWGEHMLESDYVNEATRLSR